MKMMLEVSKGTIQMNSDQGGSVQCSVIVFVVECI